MIKTYKTLFNNNIITNIDSDDSSKRVTKLESK